MRKRLLSLLTALALCLGLLPAAALAEEGDLVATVEIGSDTTSYSIGDTYTTGAAALTAAWDACKGQTATLTLKQNVSLEVSGEKNEQLACNTSGTNITLDMDDDVVLTCAVSTSKGALEMSNGSLDFRSGKIVLNAEGTATNKCAVQVSGSNAKFTLSVGSIVASLEDQTGSGDAYGVFVNGSGGTFQMTGGSIRATEGNVDCVHLWNGTAEISGGTIQVEDKGRAVNASAFLTSNLNVTISGTTKISSSNQSSQAVRISGVNTTCTICDEVIIDSNDGGGGIFSSNGSTVFIKDRVQISFYQQDGVTVNGGTVTISGDVSVTGRSSTNYAGILLGSTNYSGATVNLVGNVRISGKYGFYIQYTGVTNIIGDVQFSGSEYGLYLAGSETEATLSGGTFTSNSSTSKYAVYSSKIGFTLGDLLETGYSFYKVNGDNREAVESSDAYADPGIYTIEGELAITGLEAETTGSGSADLAATVEINPDAKSGLTTTTGTEVYWTEDPLDFLNDNYKSNSPKVVDENGEVSFNLDNLQSGWHTCYLIAAQEEGGKTYYSTVKAATFYVSNQLLTGSVSITGTEQYGEKLTANASGMPSDAGTLTYTWYRCDDETGTGAEVIANATSKSYTLTAADIGKYIKVEVKASYCYGSLTAVSGQVGKAELTVSAVTATDREYNGTDTVTITSVTLNGVKNKDDVSVDTSDLTGTLSSPNADSYQTLTLPDTLNLTGAAADNYTLTQPSTDEPINVTNRVTISPLKVVLEWSTPTTFPYDGNEHSVTATIKNAVSGDDVSLDYGDSTTKATAADNYTATVTRLSGSDAGNYTTANVENLSQPWSISAASITGATVSLDKETFTYNGSEQKPTVTVTLDGKELSAATDYTVQFSGKSINADTYTVTVTGKGNYSGTLASKTYTIEKAKLTPSIDTTEPITKTYDGTADAPTGLSITLSGVVQGDNVTATATSYTYNSADVADAMAVTAKGITLDGEDAGNYTLSDATATATGTITPAALTVTADAKSKTYGEDDPVLTYTATDLIGNDKLTGALGRDAGKDVGTYAITQGSLANTNYTITFNSANLTITKREVTLSWSEQTSFVYDGQFHSVTATTVNAVSGDDVSLDYGTSTTKATNVGEYKASVSGLAGSDAGNYTLTGDNTSQAWSITKASASAPDAAEAHIDYVAETISFDAEKYEMATRTDDTGTGINSGRSISSFMGSSLYIRTKGDANHLASDWVAVEIPKRPDAPTGLAGTKPAAKGENGTITGVTSDQEYRIAYNGAWTPVDSASTLSVQPGTYQVRFQASNDKKVFASQPTLVTVDEYVPSSNANLSNLEVSPGTLSVTFDPEHETYTVNVPHDATSVTLTPTAADSKATITVNDTPVINGTASGSIQLTDPSTPISIVVTAEDGTTKTYTVTVKVQSGIQTLIVNGTDVVEAYNYVYDEYPPLSGITFDPWTDTLTLNGAELKVAQLHLDGTAKIKFDPSGEQVNKITGIPTSDGYDSITVDGDGEITLTGKPKTIIPTLPAVPSYTGYGWFEKGETTYRFEGNIGVTLSPFSIHFNGIVYEDQTGPVYGDYTLTGDYAITAGDTLTVPEGAALTNNDALTNSGTLVVYDKNSIKGTGTITGKDNQILHVDTSDLEITVPTNAVYDGQTDYAQQVSLGLRAPITIQGASFTYALTGWTKTITRDGITVTQAIDAGTYSVTYAKNGETVEPKEWTVDEVTTAIDYEAETIQFDDAKYEMSSKADEAGTSITSGSSITSYINDSTATTVYIRIKADDSNPASAWVAVTIPQRPAAPTGLSGSNESYPGARDGKLTDVNSSMEYRTDKSSWTKVTGIEISNLGAGTYYVRTAASNAAQAFAGVPAVVNLGSEAVVLTGITIETPPDKTAYYEEDLFDSTGMVVSATYSDSNSKTVTGYTISPAGGLSMDTTAITVSYMEGSVTKTAEQPITVKALEIMGYYADQNDTALNIAASVSYGTSETDALVKLSSSGYAKLNNGAYYLVSIQWAFDSTYDGSVSGDKTVTGTVSGELPAGLTHQTALAGSITVAQNGGGGGGGGVTSYSAFVQNSISRLFGLPMFPTWAAGLTFRL